MSISVVTTFILTGSPERLREIAEQRAGRTCDAEDMRFASDTELHMTLYNGIGSAMLHHGDGLAAEYPDVTIRGMEYIDCFDDPSFAKWQAGQLVYQADLTTVFAILFPTDTVKDWPGCGAAFWERSPETAAAVADNCPHYDLMPLQQLAEPAPGWGQTSDGFAALFLRLPSTAEARDGRAVIFYPGRGRATLLEGVDRFGGFGRYRQMSYGKIAARCPELRDVLRGCWRSKKDVRRSYKRDWSLHGRAMRKRRRQKVDQTSAANWWSGKGMDVASGMEFEF